MCWHQNKKISSGWTKHQQELNEKSTPAYIVGLFQVFKGLLLKKYRSIYNNSYFISCCSTSAFTQEGIIFYNFLKLYSEVPEKRFSSQIFPFQRIHPKILSLITSPYKAKIFSSQNPQWTKTLWQKFFCWCSL